MQKESLLFLIRSDASFLFEKIVQRRADYLYVFSLKRSREQYHDVFFSRYNGTDLKSLAEINTDTLMAIESFYQLTDQLKWYLLYTKDMPPQVEDRLDFFITKIRKKFETLELYIHAEMTGKVGPLATKQPESETYESGDFGDNRLEIEKIDPSLE
jgi:hypothetical protein